MRQPDTTCRRSLGVTVAAVALALASVATPTLAFAAPGAATQSMEAVQSMGAAQSSGAGPAVETVTTNRTGGNLTVSVRATNVTEVDVTGVPDGWSVAAHDDDYGAYAAQLDEDRVFWFWRVPVAVNVSVTFETPANAGRPADLAVVPYDGTERGQAVAVFPEAATPTPTRTATEDSEPGQTVTASPVATPTETPASGDAPSRETTGTTDGTGPGFGGGSVLVALVLVVLVARRRD